MKYPQLVSTRAVNAISDWLVSRLEQLGVEAPLIYSRLLLSLLQSSVQINDPIEFSNLETFLVNRKGKRYPPCDTDTLKKVNAVKCLMDIVSSEQEITKIENLIDELCEKVNDIEKQSTNLEEDDCLQIGTSILNSVETTLSSSPSSSTTLTSLTKPEETLSHSIGTSIKGGGSRSKSSEVTAASLSLSARKSNDQAILDVEDLRKRYYRAFPALSKEMENSIELLRRNNKLLTWPAEKKTNLAKNSSVVLGTVCNKNSSSEKDKAVVAGAIDEHHITTLGNLQKQDPHNTVLCNTAGVKRKTKRRRNQAMSKGKTINGNNMRKHSHCGGSNSPNWDTDFEGSWEMGRDLIKEFIIKQNNRNRSTSESAAYNPPRCNTKNTMNTGSNVNASKSKKRIDTEDGTYHQQLQAVVCSKDPDSSDVTENLNKIWTESCHEEEQNDLLRNSTSNLISARATTPRRLYERDTLNEQGGNNHPQPIVTESPSEQFNYAQLKAKFNSAVEALWTKSNLNDTTSLNNIKSDPSGSDDLKNFWANYYSHHYNANQSNPLSYDNSSDCLTSGAAGIFKNFDETDEHNKSLLGSTTKTDGFYKSVGGKTSGCKSSPVGVFLQNSIWSDNANLTYSDSDESFFIKAMNCSTKFQDQSKMEVPGNDKLYYIPYQGSKWSEGINGVPHDDAVSMQNSYYQQPQKISQPQQQLLNAVSSSSSSISTTSQSTRNVYINDFTEPTSMTTSSLLGGNPNWQATDGDNLQADLQSWNSSNPTSLTELYGGGDNSISIGKNNYYNSDRSIEMANISVEVLTPPNSSSSSSASTSACVSSSCFNDSSVTLSNHSVTSSGFIAYSRVKSYLKIVEPSNLLPKWSNPEKQDSTDVASSTALDDDNLLTSEKTHFLPIKMNYADGHTFEITSNIDSVDFERSESGFLYLESEKYLEYTRTDVMVEDDQLSLDRCPSESDNDDCHNSSTDNVKDVTEFIIRFRVRTTDKGCQTSFIQQVGNPIYRSPLRVQSESSSLNETETKNEWIDEGCNSKETDKMEIDGKDDEECISMEPWSMVEIGKKCVDNNNASHTLWGMCSTCRNDITSIPADQMMKAELNVEGDEIMSHLRYMQDLYIDSEWEDKKDTTDDDCRDGEGDDENDSDVGGGGDGVDGDGDGDGDDTDLDADVIRDSEVFDDDNSLCQGAYPHTEIDDQQHNDMMYNVNKLIADLLRPENAQTLVNALGAVAAGPVVSGIAGAVGGGFSTDKHETNPNVEMAKNKDERYVGGLWNSNENIIWKKEFTAMDIFSSLNYNTHDSFLDKLDWEYSNLAEIWGKTSPTLKNIWLPNKQSSDRFDLEKHNSTESILDDQNLKIATKNMKNLLKSNFNCIPNENSTIFELNERHKNDSKRIPCLLASNKFKASNRIDRKRRHSASQNFFSNNSTNNNNNNDITCNNNNVYIESGLKCNTLMENQAYAANDEFGAVSNNKNENKATIQETFSDYGRNILCNQLNNEQMISFNDDDQKQEQEQHQELQRDNDSHATIITCKYWATMHPIFGGDSLDHSDEQLPPNMFDHSESASFFLDKNHPQFIQGVVPSITLNTSTILKHVALVSRPLTR